MAEIRLSKLTKEFNIGLQTLVDFLNEKGAGVDMNPNAKISDSFLPAIEAKFGDEQKLKQDSEKVAIKLKEIIEMGSKKKSAAEDEEEPVKEIIIKSNSFAHSSPVQEEPESQARKPETPAGQAPLPQDAPETEEKATGSVPAEEQEEVKEQIRFMKEYRHLIQFGTFYRLKSPFDGNITAWMTVSSDRKEAVAGWYRTLNGVNMSYTRLRLQGLDPEAEYEVGVRGSCERGISSGTQAFRIGTRCGDELMNLGLITSDVSSGQNENAESCDFDSRIYILKAK